MERQIIRYQGELWSEIPGHHGKYFASRNGQILSLAKSQSKPRVLRQIRDGEYLHVFLYDGTREKLRVHRAVLLAWDREPLPDEECRHLNDCHGDNRLENLCWGSRQENVDDKRVNDKMPVGERSGTHKLTEAEVLEIRKARSTASLRELGAKYGVSHTAIRRAMLGIKWGYLEEGLR